MKLVHKEEELAALVQNIKKPGTFITNFFPDPEKVSYWIKSKHLYYLDSEYSVLFLRKNESFFHLYYSSTSIEDLQHIILNYLPEGQIVTDIIGKEQPIRNFVEVFIKAGFRLHTQLHRFTRINDADKEYYNLSGEVLEATLHDIDEISRLFEDNFDKFSEQVPTSQEVTKLIEDRKILVVRGQSEIKGFLVRTTTGLTTLLNNFLVRKTFRGEKIGSKLLKHYIFESKDTKRMILWVIYDNDTAINVYKRHGYVKDDLVDFVLIK
jgi:GNAT superfamily N-acetyltransferase